MKQVLTNWGGILSQLTGVTKTYLKMATRSLGPNGELMLVFDDKNAYEYVEQNRSDCQDALKAAAADRIGKEVAILVKLNDTGHASDEVYPDLARSSRWTSRKRILKLDESHNLYYDRWNSPKRKAGGSRHGKRGGFPGGMPGNMNNLMKQAQKMQRQMEEAQKELEEKEVTAAAGGGAVEVTINGKKEITSIKLAEEIVDPEDIETLQDAIVAAANEALRKADEANAELMGKMTGGLGGFPF